MERTRVRERKPVERHEAPHERGRFTEQLIRSLDVGRRPPDAVQEGLEETIGARFADLRIHDDSEAAALAGDMDARAFAVGSHIFFAPGTYAPSTDAGWELLVHEATHVRQHGDRAPDAAALRSGMSVVDRDDASEVEARENASAGRPLSPAADGARTASEAGHGHAGAVAIHRDGPVDFKLLPPEVKANVGPATLDATTSKAGLNLNLGGGADVGLGYKYGDALSLSGKYGGLSGSLGYNPSSGGMGLSGKYGDVSGSMAYDPTKGLTLGGGGKLGDVGFHGSLNPGTGGFNAGLSLGAGLLPMPDALTTQMNAAGGVVPGLMGDLPAGVGDPLDYYKAHSQDISKLTGAAGTLTGIAGEGGAGGLQFGAGLNVGYDPTKHDWRVMAGIQGSF